MSKHQKTKRSGEDEPPRKVTKFFTKSIQDGMQTRQQPLRRSLRNSPPKTPLTIHDLPTEILEKITGHINIWHHNRIRATSKRFKEVNDLFVMHQFKKAYKQSVIQNPNSYESAVLRSIRQATEVYVRSGFQSTFCGCILPMLRSSYRDPFSPQISEINKFLVHFYKIIEDSIGDTNSLLSRLLYTVTLMRFFKALNESLCISILSSTAMPLHWRIEIELKGPWLGILWTSKNKPSNGSIELANLLAILTEILIASINKRAFKRVWESSSEIYIFGNDTSNGKHVPLTLFTFIICGSKKILSLFRSCLEDDPQHFKWPLKWPKDEFTVSLDFTCKEAIRWGCSKSHHMEFGQRSKKTFSDKDEYHHYENYTNSDLYAFD